MTLPQGAPGGQAKSGPFADANANGQRARKSDSLRTVAELAKAKALPVKFLADQGLSDLPGGGISIPYYDASGNEMFRRTRGAPGDGQRFRQPKGVSLAPYGLWHLADLGAGGTLYLTEGESDAWALWHSGYLALGLPGSSSVGCLRLEHLSGVKVLHVAPDNDTGGRVFAEGVGRRLSQIGYAGAADVLHLPAGCKDVSDLHCRNPGGFRGNLAGLIQLATPISAGQVKTPGQDVASRTVRLTSCETLCMRPTRWLVPDFIPRGGLTVIAGDGGEGKSAITLHLAAKVGRGEPCLGLNYEPPRRASVILAGCEDSAETTVIPRLAAAGADLSMAKLLDATLDEKGRELPFTLADVDALDATLETLSDAALVVIDPVSAFIPGKVDDHRDAEVRGLLRPLAELAARRDLAIVLVKHLNKSDSPNSGNLVAGSRAYVNAARAAFLVGADPTDEGGDRCVLVYSKRNLTSRSKGLAYSKVPLSIQEQRAVLAIPQARRLSEAERRLLGGQLFRVEWHGETDVTDRDLTKARRVAADDRRSARGEAAAAWLREFLASGPKDSEKVHEAAKRAGISRNALLEGKVIIGVKVAKQHFSGTWRWGLPGDAPA